MILAAWAASAAQFFAPRFPHNFLEHSVKKRFSSIQISHPRLS
jgi:hypothetical protein